MPSSPPSSPPSPEPEPEPGFDIFTEPASFRPAAQPPTTTTHTLTSGAHETLTLHLVGHNPLWGHKLWHASRTTSTYLEQHPALVLNKHILELGAGAGLPSITCALRGAARVVATDYPDPDLIANLAANATPYGVTALGYVWGRDTASLAPGNGFDTVVMADLLFNHSQHGALVETLAMVLRKGGTALVFFTPHRPWLIQRDLGFFEVVGERGFVVRKVLEERWENPMFMEDPGDPEVRRMVFGYEVGWKEVEG